jgi:hypothetical protein
VALLGMHEAGTSQSRQQAVAGERGGIGFRHTAIAADMGRGPLPFPPLLCIQRLPLTLRPTSITPHHTKDRPRLKRAKEELQRAGLGID